MIEKLREKRKEEVIEALGAEFGDAFSDLFGPLVQPQLPTEQEMMDKINEIIEYLNKLEAKVARKDEK